MTLLATPLPTPEALAALVTNVTKTMFGLTFSLEQGATPEGRRSWQAAILPIPGKRPLTVAIAADGDAGRTLAGAMFSCPAASADPSMVRDSLSELVNILAGQVKSALALDQALGLPRFVDEGAGLGSPAEQWRSATLSRGETSTQVWVAVTEQIL